jgi:hypothetical protein
MAPEETFFSVSPASDGATMTPFSTTVIGRRRIHATQNISLYFGIGRAGRFGWQRENDRDQVR